MIGLLDNNQNSGNAGNNKTEKAISKTVTEAGKTLIVNVRPMFGKDEIDELGNERWEVSIEGKQGQCTTWSNWYPTAEQALQRGMAAILEEGVDEFYDNRMFPCL